MSRGILASARRFHIAADRIQERELMQPVTVAIVFLLVLGLVAIIVINPGSTGREDAQVALSDAPPALSDAPPALSDSPPLSEAPVEEPLAPVQGMETHVNVDGGYGFRHPSGWEVTDDGTVSKLQSPVSDVVVSFGLMPRGNLGEASSRLVTSLQDAQRNTHIIGQQTDLIGGTPSVLVSGLGTNGSGLRVRFLAITVRGDPTNYAIAVFVPADSDASQLLPPIQRIVSSFRPSIPEDAAV